MRAFPNEEIEVSCLAKVGRRHEKLPITGLSRRKGSREKRAGRYVHPRTVLVPATSTVSWVVQWAYSQARQDAMNSPLRLQILLFSPSLR